MNYLHDVMGDPDLPTEPPDWADRMLDDHFVSGAAATELSAEQRSDLAERRRREVALVQRLGSGEPEPDPYYRYAPSSPPSSPPMDSRPLDPQGPFAVGALTPTPDGWARGDRTLWCGVQAPGSATDPDAMLQIDARHTAESASMNRK